MTPGRTEQTKISWLLWVVDYVMFKHLPDATKFNQIFHDQI